MKIYFDGCSWTQGAELENPEEERFSRLICNELGAEETNLGIGGGSNDRIIRNLLVENNIEEYDLAVIQMTLPARTEYWDNKWIKINPKANFSSWLYQNNLLRGKLAGTGINIDNLASKFSDHGEFWKYFYTKVSNKHYFDVKEKVQFETIKGFCISKGVPLIICTINKWTKLKFDLLFVTDEYTRSKKAHPNKLGHQLIAESIINFKKIPKIDALE